MQQLPYSEACERNKGPILDVLRACLVGDEQILEVGSGTGQHVVHFARELPGTHWQPSDIGDYLPGLRARLTHEQLPNISSALEIDVRDPDWPVERTGAMFSANTLHFMSELCVAAFFAGAGRTVAGHGLLIVYGPFRYNGRFTSESNERFDGWLKSTAPDRGVRDFERVSEMAEAEGFRLMEDIAMPANNQCLIWGRITKP